MGASTSICYPLKQDLLESQGIAVGRPLGTLGVLMLRDGRRSMSGGGCLGVASWAPSDTGGSGQERRSKLACDIRTDKLLTDTHSRRRVCQVSHGHTDCEIVLRFTDDLLTYLCTTAFRSSKNVEAGSGWEAILSQVYQARANKSKLRV
jgi:hypothetical protein